MSLRRTKEQLLKLLDQADNHVIALSGKWGTGKTHLWNEVKAGSADEKVQSALYVSLFGLSSIDQVKRKLIETAIPGVDSHGGLFDGLKDLFKAGVKAASEHYKALAAINDLNVILMAPVLLRSKLIVIDDIERKHQSLGIDEVLGFIDEYSRQHGSRFVLVLNDDQLSTNCDQKNIWETFREKVIDQEIKLSTSSDEAFSIAIGIRPSKYAEAIRKSSITCGITNIRVVLKIIKVANKILDGYNLDESIQTRVIPSIVLFSAIYYRGMDDGPDLKFALNVGNSNWGNFFKEKNKEPTPEEKREGVWRMLMQELGIHECDEFEKQLVEYLESGLFDAGRTEAVIDRYTTESEAMKAKEAAHKFHERICWDHRIGEAQLVTEAAVLPDISGHLDPFLATELHSVLAQLLGGKEIGDAIIDGWIAGFRKRNPPALDDENPFNKPLHPKIQAEFAAIKETVQANETIVDACMHVMQNNGWGTQQELTLRQATAADFEAAIRKTEDLVQFRRFMRQMIKMRINREAYDPHFGSTTERFVEACRAIANDADSPRLARLIRRLFDDTHLAPELAPQSCATGQAPNA